MDGSTIKLPFDPAQVVDNLRFERYRPGNPGIGGMDLFRSIYYFIRPFLGTSVRQAIQRFYFRQWRDIDFPGWPVDRSVEEILERLIILAIRSSGIDRLPFVWFWPDGAPSCTMVTHDVETAAGLAFCDKLIELDDSFGIKSSIHLVPEGRYRVSESILESIRNRGFEINIHDLNHDGLLWSDRDEFLRRAKKINAYGRQFGSQGFRSAVMYRNVEWYDALDFYYDMSIPNVAHLDPQRGGCCTVLPFFIGKILELPLTTAQDYSLFAILRDYSIRLWQEQISLIKQKHGLISFIVHPDYIMEPKPQRVYLDLLRTLSELRSNGETWIALPGDIAQWWRLRNELNLVRDGDDWRVEGPGSERAMIAYAAVVEGQLTYEISPASQATAVTPDPLETGIEMRTS